MRTTASVPFINTTATPAATLIAYSYNHRTNAYSFTATDYMLMCWCIGKAASQVEEFYTLPVDGKLYRYDKLAINVIVENSKGGISSCDIPFHDDLQQFDRDYLSLTAQAANECKSSCFASDQRSSAFLDDHMGGCSRQRCQYRSNSITFRWMAARLHVFLLIYKKS